MWITKLEENERKMGEIVYLKITSKTNFDILRINLHTYMEIASRAAQLYYFLYKQGHTQSRAPRGVPQQFSCMSAFHDCYAIINGITAGDRRMPNPRFFYPLRVALYIMAFICFSANLLYE